MGKRKHWSGDGSPKCRQPSKRSKIDKRCRTIAFQCDSSIVALPIEILYEIFSYLSPQELYTVCRVCSFFDRIARDPAIWRTYEVINNTMDTIEVIDELKRMPFLKRFTIDARADSDDILRQLSLTNKNLEELYISNCTGSTVQLHLRSLHLTRILEKCSRLHTISILGARFRGLKFYRLLGDMGTRLRAASTPATCSQFQTFARYACHIPEEGRQDISTMCLGAKGWAPLHYFVVERGGHTSSVLVSYLYKDFISVDI